MSRLVVGLGNPGPEYTGTRHNVGFEVVDRLAHLLEVRGRSTDAAEGPQDSPTSPSGDLLFRSARHLDGYGGRRTFRWWGSAHADAWLLKPVTFMNLSGQAVAPFCSWSELAPEDLLVVYDDWDLDVGRLRIRPHGGAGGQKGMRSIIDELGTDRFPRLRVGIGRPGTDAARYVLTPFTPDERVEIDISVAEASEAITAWLDREELSEVMTRFHSRWSAD